MTTNKKFIPKTCLQICFSHGDRKIPTEKHFVHPFVCVFITLWLVRLPSNGETTVIEFTCDKLPSDAVVCNDMGSESKT